MSETAGENGPLAADYLVRASSSTRRGIAVAASIIMAGNVTSRLLGLVREQVMAGLFGATGGTDAFVAAYTVPIFVYDLLVGGAISAALVPVLVDASLDERRFWRVASALFTLSALAATVVVILLILVAPEVMALLGAGFSQDRQALAVLMLRVMLPSVLLQALAGVAVATLYSRQLFGWPAIGAAALNASIIVAALLFQAELGLMALVVGVVLGAIAYLFLLLPGLLRLGVQFRPALDLGMPEVRTALRLYLPVMAGMSVTLIGVAIDRNLASGLEEGSLTVMRYATTLLQFPVGLVGIAIASAVLPPLARAASAQPNTTEYQETLIFGVRLVFLVAVPALVGFALLREPLIRLLFERGEFTSFDSARTAAVFLAYAPQLPLTALDQLLIVAFYARKDTRTPVLVGAATVLLYLVVALATIGPLRVVGLALANTAQNGAHGLILLGLLVPVARGLASGDMLAFLGRIGVAGGVMAVSLAASLALVPGEGVAADAAALATGGLVGGMVYLGLAHLLGVAEARILWRWAAQRRIS